jgi:ribosomal-protein-alanine N-acetyltransferase
MLLITNRLQLREFVKEDWQAVLAYQQKPEYLKFYDWTERSAGEVREFVGMFLDQQQADPRIKFQLAVTLKTTGQLIGNCGIRLESVEAREADIGLELDPSYWSQGYATEAAQAIMRFGFDHLNLHRIWARSNADNQAAGRVLEKLGMQLEGRLRENEYFKGRWWDTILYAILDSEWKAGQVHDEVNQQ